MFVKIPPGEVRTVVRKMLYKPCALVAVEGALKGWSERLCKDVHVQIRFNGSVMPAPLQIGADPFWSDGGFAVHLRPFPIDHEGELAMVVINQSKEEITARGGLIMGEYITGIQ